MEKKSSLPTLKLVDNVPIAVRFDGVQGKELFNEQYGTKSYMYILYDLSDNEMKKVWFATERQQAILQEHNIQPNQIYTLLKHKLPEDKYTQFKVTPGEKVHLDALENYLANKGDQDGEQWDYIAPEAAAWALKSAVSAYDLFARNHMLPGGENLIAELESIALTFLRMQKNVMAKGQRAQEKAVR